MSALPAQTPDAARRQPGHPGAGAPGVTFAPLGVPAAIAAALAAAGITTPFPIQAITLP